MFGEFHSFLPKAAAYNLRTLPGLVTEPGYFVLGEDECEDWVLDGPASENKGPYALTPNTVELTPNTVELCVG